MSALKIVLYVLLALALWQAVYCGELAVRLAVYPKGWLRREMRHLRNTSRPPPGSIHLLYDEARPVMLKVNAWTSAFCWAVAGVVALALYWLR